MRGDTQQRWQRGKPDSQQGEGGEKGATPQAAPRTRSSDLPGRSPPGGGPVTRAACLRNRLLAAAGNPCGRPVQVAVDSSSRTTGVVHGFTPSCAGLQQVACSGLSGAAQGFMEVSGAAVVRLHCAPGPVARCCVKALPSPHGFHRLPPPRRRHRRHQRALRLACRGAGAALGCRRATLRRARVARGGDAPLPGQPRAARCRAGAPSASPTRSSATTCA